MLLIALLVVGGFALYVMTSEERIRLLRKGLGTIDRVKSASSLARPVPGPFLDALCARTPFPLVTPVLAALNVIVFLLMVFGPGALSDPETLVSWGGNFGPRTTNGEWWRLIAATFVHASAFRLLVNVIGLIHVGLVLERLYGHAAFTTAYFAAGLVASVLSLSGSSTAVNVGAAGAVSGVYGLFAVTLVWGLIYRSPLTIPVTTLKTLAAPAAIFVVCNVLATDSVQQRSELAAMAVGIAWGLTCSKGISEGKPPIRRVAIAAAAAIGLAGIAAIPMRGLTDVRPEIERIVATEGRTAGIYEHAVDQFRRGTMSAEVLAQLIDRTITPELQALQTRLKTLDRVPAKHQAMIASAEEYLRLREESWRVRSSALHNANMKRLREADRTEWASMQAFQKIKQADLQ